MPSSDKVQRSDLSHAVDSFLKSKRKAKGGPGDGGEEDFLSILEFIDRFKLLPNGLFPVQKFIIKLYYNIPLDDFIPESPHDRIKIFDKHTLLPIQEVSEVDYLKYLHSQGRCNIGEQDGKDRRELILVLGRRSGKSNLSAIISAYEIYKLLRRGNPQSHYGMPAGSEIRILCVANDKEQASIVYGDMSTYVGQVDYFKSSIVHDTLQYMRFQTQSDRERFGEGKGKKGTITATFKSSIAKGLRGRGIICFILDELAFFIDDGKSSAKRVYDALSPSTMQFTPKDPKNMREAAGGTEGRKIAISSPDAKEGFFYNLYQLSLSRDKASEKMLMIQAPTWEVRPDLSREDFEVEYAKDPRTFDTEFGANFSDRVRGWITDSRDLTECIDPVLRPHVMGRPRDPHWAGVDFGISKDGTAISLTHINNGKIELAYHEVWYPRKKWKESNPHLPAPLVPYANTLHTVTRLDIDEIAKWLSILSRRFYITKGVFDQWAGPIFEQKLHKEGLVQFESRNFTSYESSLCYSATEMLLLSRTLSIYDYPIPEVADIGLSLAPVVHSPHIMELLELQASSGGKNIVIVEAPDIPGKHDDFSDSLARSCYLVSEHIKEHPDALQPGVIQTLARRPMAPRNAIHARRLQMRLHGPPPKERRVPMFQRRAR